jgi:superfamily II DNA or RNA helicase
MATMTLRPYQESAVTALLKAWDSGVRRPAVVAATGAGKTVMFAHLIAAWALANQGRRAVVVVHTNELVEQTLNKVRDNAPHLSTGVVKAARDETDADVIVASVQTLRTKGRVERIADVGLVVVDEAHHYAAKEWRSVLERLGCFAPGGPVVAGFTATMVRADTAKLSTVWDDVVADIPILDLIRAGYLCDVRAKAIEIEGLDLATVSKQRGGDFSEGSLSEAMIDAEADKGIVKAYTDHGEGRQAGLFAPSVEFARVCMDAFNAAGVPAAMISGATPLEERERIYADYRAEKIRILCNCMVLTEGFDMPQMACGIIARPTTNPGLYTQIVGRILRTYPGKDDALILDVVGVTDNLKLMSLVDLSPEAVRPEDGESLMEALERVRREKRRGGGVLPLELMTARQVDMFNRSSVVWKQTFGGVWFLSNIVRTYVLWPYADGETFQVMSFRKQGARNTIVVAKDLDMDTAVATAEREALVDEERAPFSVVDKGAPWRHKRVSKDALALALRLGAQATEDMKGGEVSDLIDTALVSKFLDPQLVKVGTAKEKSE